MKDLGIPSDWFYSKVIKIALDALPLQLCKPNIEDYISIIKIKACSLHNELTYYRLLYINKYSIDIICLHIQYHPYV